MKKTAYMAPAINIEMIEVQPLLNTVSGVKGDSGVTKADPTEEIPSEGDARRRRDVWDDDEEEEEVY